MLFDELPLPAFYFTPACRNLSDFINSMEGLYMKADMNIPGGGLPPFWQIAENPAPGLGWPKYGLIHWAWLFAGAVTIFLLLMLYRKLSPKSRKIMAWLVVSIQLLNELDTQVMLISTGQWTISDLPLHMCSLTEIVFLIHIIHPSRMMSAIVYAIAFPSAILGLFLPTWSVLPLWNFAAIHSFVFHFTMILYSLMLFVDGYRPRLADLKKALVPILAVSAAVFIFNKIAGTDFMYTNGGKGVGFLEALVGVLGNYGYLIIFPALLVVIWGVMFLPFEIYERRKKETQ